MTGDSWASREEWSAQEIFHFSSQGERRPLPLDFVVNSFAVLGVEDLELKKEDVCAFALEHIHRCTRMKGCEFKCRH